MATDSIRPSQLLSKLLDEQLFLREVFENSLERARSYFDTLDFDHRSESPERLEANASCLTPSSTLEPPVTAPFHVSPASTPLPDSTGTGTHMEGYWAEADLTPTSSAPTILQPSIAVPRLLPRAGHATMKLPKSSSKGSRLSRWVVKDDVCLELNADG